MEGAFCGPRRQAFAYERVGGIVRVIGQTVLPHPAGYVLQPVTVVLLEEDAGKLGAGILGVIGS